MSVLDLVALGIVGYNTLRGLASGLVRTSFGLAAVAVASTLAWKHAEWGHPLVAPFMPASSPWWGLAQPLAIWALTFAAVNAVGIALRMVLDRTPLRAIDRIGGAAFGFATGAVILAVPLVLLTRLPLLRQLRPLQESLQGSVVASALSPVIAAIRPMEAARPGSGGKQGRAGR